MSGKAKPGISISRLSNYLRLVFYISLPIVLWSHNHHPVVWALCLLEMSMLSDLVLFIRSLYFKGDESN